MVVIQDEEVWDTLKVSAVILQNEAAGEATAQLKNE